MKVNSSKVGWGWLIGLGVCQLGIAELAVADIVTDGSLGASTTLTGPDFEIGQELGQVRGDNLFHSFERFSIDLGESATFTGSENIANVISRVTGGELSSINGAINDSFNNANFYFINPAGVMFGAGASLNTSGSFHVSTADSLRFEDGVEFIGRLDAEGVNLTAAAPEAFAFNASEAAAIQIEGSELVVGSGQKFELAGGDIVITASAIQTYGGDLDIQSQAGSEVSIAASWLTTTGPEAGGTIAIRGGDLVVEESFVETYSFGGSDSGDLVIDSESVRLDAGTEFFTGTETTANGGDIQIDADTLVIQRGSGLYTNTYYVGDAGDIRVAANEMLVDDGSQLRTQSLGEGNAGDINLSIDQSLTITGENLGGSSSRLVSSAGNRALTGSVANAGDITINTGSLTASNGALILARTFGAGDAGDIRVQAGSDILLSGSSSSGNTATIGADASGVTGGSDGNGGDIFIAAESLTLTNSAAITADNVDPSSSDNLGSTGDAGNITIALSNHLEMALDENANEFDFAPLILARSFDGAGGLINITAGSAALNDGAQIQSTTRGVGDAGNILLNIENDLSISGFDPNYGTFSGVISSTESGSAGDAGDIQITAGRLRLQDGAVIVSDSIGTGRGGDIVLSIGNELTMSGNLPQDIAIAELAGLPSYIVSDSSGGPAGDISISSQTIRIQDGAIISSSTRGAERAGDILIQASSVELVGTDRSTAKTPGGIYSATFAGGAGGNIQVFADSVAIRDGATVASESQAEGIAGDITIETLDQIVLADASIRASALGADGGNIVVNATQRVQLDNSEISTSVGSGAGNGGNISIDPVFVILDNSAIRANAFGGSGGNIQIVAENFIATPTSLVEAVAKSSNGIDGTVYINTPERDLSGQISRAAMGYQEGKAVDTSPCQSGVDENVIRLRLSHDSHLRAIENQALRSPMILRYDESPAGNDSAKGEQIASANHRKSLCSNHL